MEKKDKSTALTSLIFGLLIWIPFLNWVFSIVAAYLGIKAIGNIKKNPQQYSGRWMAIIGLILGIIGFILNVVYFLAVSGIIKIENLAV